jgi:hypothetical protein
MRKMNDDSMSDDSIVQSDTKISLLKYYFLVGMAFMHFIKSSDIESSFIGL